MIMFSVNLILCEKSKKRRKKLKHNQIQSSSPFSMVGTKTLHTVHLIIYIEHETLAVCSIVCLTVCVIQSNLSHIFVEFYINRSNWNEYQRDRKKKIEADFSLKTGRYAPKVWFLSLKVFVLIHRFLEPWIKCSPGRPLLLFRLLSDVVGCWMAPPLALLWVSVSWVASPVWKRLLGGLEATILDKTRSK